jgi:hypothetical protein
MPFIIGVPTDTLARTRDELDLNEVVVVDLDAREFRSPFDDVELLPKDVVSSSGSSPYE